MYEQNSRYRWKMTMNLHEHSSNYQHRFESNRTELLLKSKSNSNSYLWSVHRPLWQQPLSPPSSPFFSNTNPRSPNIKFYQFQLSKSQFLHSHLRAQKESTYQYYNWRFMWKIRPFLNRNVELFEIRKKQLDSYVTRREMVQQSGAVSSGGHRESNRY